MSLRKYHQKRDFKKTTEPKGKVERSSARKKLRYLIQKHAASHLHYDFRIELDGVLKSWAVPKGPCLDPSVKRLSMHVEDHPLAYGSFEGIIPKGQYGGGTVMLWDEGEWEPVENPHQGYQKGDLKILLKGQKLKGLWKLIRLKKADKAWLLIKVKDKYAKNLRDTDITLDNKSIKTDRTMDEIAQEATDVWQSNKNGKINLKKEGLKQKPWLTHINFQLATLVEIPPEGNEWLHEMKWDGYRLLATIKPNEVQLITRGKKDWTTKFPTIARDLKKISHTAILDGEIVALDRNRTPNFQLLQNSLKAKSDKNFYYYVFDILYLDGYDLRMLPLIKRKAYLESIIPPNSQILLSTHFIGNGSEIFEKCCHLKLEGIVSKRLQSVYSGKRDKQWLKIKCKQHQEFIICGFTLPQGTRDHFGSLLVGTHKNNRLIYCGHVGTGFNQATLTQLYALLKKHETSKMPFTTRPPASQHAKWVKPILRIDVEFTEWTDEGILRHPSFKGLHQDKSASPPIKLTHPQKILYPEDNITKLEVAEYFNTVADWILPFIKNRPLSIVRCPEGYQKCFFQKHIERSIPHVINQVEITEKQTKKNYIYLENANGLLALAQMGVLEIHPWSCTIDSLEYPDFLVIDLDPAPDVKWKDVVACAFQIKEILKNYGLKSFVKTTGGKGLHVVFPIKPEYTWEQIKNFAKTLVDYLVSDDPRKYIGVMTKSKRKGKIFIDYLRNQRGATAVAAYSTRARSGAPVSVPLAWDELTAKYEDTYYDLRSLPTRLTQLKKDPWHDFFLIQQSLG